MIRNVQGWVAVMMLGAAGAAQAGGLLLAPEALPAQTQKDLAARISAARSANPDSFARVQGIARDVRKMDAAKKGRMAAVGPSFNRLGPSALWSMVDLIAFDAHGVDAGLDTDSARTALKVGLIEAAGRLRDERAAPLWSAILDGSGSLEVLRAGAEALAKLDTDAAASKLVAVSKSDGLRREAALWAMGNCRRLTVATALAEALPVTKDTVQAKRIIQALGDVGNAWAWKTPAVKAHSEEGAIRRLAAETLVKAFVAAGDDEVRQAASNALMVVDAPETTSLLQAARAGRSSSELAALDALAGRFAKNPTR